jgi:Raf kinase inhibitor-like YbhB/YbcL family protein
MRVDGNKPLTHLHIKKMHSKKNLIMAVLLFLFLLCFYQSKFQSNPLAIAGEKAKITIKSPAFEDGGMIPKKYTCDGEDISPPLKWTSIPEGTKSLALISDDPDAPAGVWVHWVIYDIPPDTRELPENIPPQWTLDNGAKQGKNDFGKIGYGGPCPPGGTHRYYFKIYALDAEINLEAGATKAELLRAMEGHILAEAQLMGKYRR